LLHASFRPHLAVTPLRFATLHLHQVGTGLSPVAAEHARRTNTKPRDSFVRGRSLRIAWADECVRRYVRCFSTLDSEFYAGCLASSARRSRCCSGEVITFISCQS
jgi:hypothetical protein